MSRLQWLELWDHLRVRIEKKNSWGKNEVLSLMDSMERDAIRKLEVSHENV